MRIGIVLVLAFSLTAAPAHAQDRICRGQHAPKPPPTEAEKEQANLEHWAATRAEFGFRHDIPYVRELVRRGVWEYDVGYIPVTPRENEYLKLRDRLNVGAKGYRYLRRHRDVAGGISVEDDWPREPYLLLRFKRDVAQHLAAIKKVARFPDNLRAKRVRFSERELRRIGDRIWRDERELRAAGFNVSTTGSTADHLEVDVITMRTDAPAYFRKRYGTGVRVQVTATEEFVLVCRPSSVYQIAGDGLSLVVTWASGGGAKPVNVEVAEHADRVEIGAVERVYTGPVTADLTPLSMAAALQTPLGDRAVIDAATGKRLRQVGPSPGDPPCPERAEPTRLEQAIEARQKYGMRSDPAYVQQRLNSRSLYTRAEQRWIALLQDIDQGDEEKISAYLRKRTDDFAGSFVVASYPNLPAVVYRFARNAQAHETAIKRRSEHPARVRVENVGYTIGQLEALEERIANDAAAGDGFFDGYGRAGFYVAGAHVDTPTGTVVVRVIATRTDHAAYFAARYGPLVRTEVRGDRFECGANWLGITG